MNNLREIKLGAPTSIEGGASPNAELSVQIASGIKELILHDEDSKCTSDGAIVTAAKLISQRLEESSVIESTWEGMTARYGDNLANVIANGGDLQLSVVDSSGTPQKAYWDVEILESEDGATATISQDGTLSLAHGKKIIGKVRAISWEDCMKQVIFEFAEYPSLASVIDKYPSLAYILIGFPDIVPIIEHPAIGEAIGKYPFLINSFANTGATNWLMSDGKAYINTGIFNSWNTLEVKLSVKIAGLDEVGTGFFGAREVSNSYKSPFIGVAYGAIVSNCGDGTTIYSPIRPNADTSWEFGVFFDAVGSRRLFSQNGKITAANSVANTANDNDGYMVLFADGDNRMPSFKGGISRAEIILNGELKVIFVPFCTVDGICGMLDVLTLQFFPNSNTSGAFTIATE